MLVVMAAEPEVTPPAAPAAVRVETLRMLVRDFGSTGVVARLTSKVLAALLILMLLVVTGMPLRNMTSEILAGLWLVLAGGSLVLLVVLCVVWLVALRRRVSGAGEIRADARTMRLRLHDQEDTPAHHVEHAWARGHFVVFRLRGGREVQVPRADVRDEEGLLDLLARGDPSAATRFPLHRAHLLWHDAPVVVYGALTAFALLGTVSRPYLIMLLSALGFSVTLAIALLARALAGAAPTGALVVGADGLRIERGGRARFLSFADISTVHPMPRGMVLTLRSGKVLRLHLVPSRLLSPRSASSPLDQLARKRVAAAYELVAHQLDEYGVARALPAHAPATAPTVEGWRRAIGAALHALGSSYRGGGLTPAGAAEIAADPRVPRPQRIGAALAVADSSDAEARQRVRIAAGLCADEDLRVALEEAAEGELAGATRERLGEAS
jgi:hypothetical protein